MAEIHESMPFEEYCRLDAINASAINSAVDGRHINIRAMQHYLQHGTEETDAMRLGTLFHSCVLEPDSISDRVEVIEGNRNRNDVKEAIRDARAAGKVVMKPDEYDKLCGMLTSIHDPHHSQALNIIRAADQRELTITWDDPDTGLACKARIDMALTQDGTLADLKSTVSPGGAFSRSIATYGYHRQMAWYRRGWSIVTGELCNMFIVAVQNVPAYSISCFDFDPGDLDMAEHQCKQVIQRYAAWRESGEKTAPGLPNAMTTAVVPDWAKEPLEE